MTTAQVNGAEIEFLLQGNGEPILLLPGLGTGMGYYSLGEPLLRRQYQTLLVDPRGIGGSITDDKNFSADQWSDDFADLARQLGIARLHVLGSSHGGCMAMAMAERHPDLVSSLVLVGGFSELDTLMRMNFELRIDLVDRLGMSPELGRFIAMWIMSHGYLETAEGQAQSERTIAMVQRNDPEIYKALCQSILDWGRALPGQEDQQKITERLKHLKVPTLAITGDDDQFIPARMSQIIAAAIPGCEYQEIAGCGHIPFMERPSETAAAVVRFLGQNPITT